MAFTTDQYNKLIAAIARGALKVKYADKEVNYHSLQEMLQLKKVMEIDLGLSRPGVSIKLAKFTTGL